MTSARPIAISRSRVQTRISLRSECPAKWRIRGRASRSTWALRLPGPWWLKDVARPCFAFFRCLVFITWASRATPDVALPGDDSGNGECLRREPGRVVCPCHRTHLDSWPLLVGRADSDVLRRPERSSASQRRDHSGFGPQDQFAEGCLPKAGCRGQRQFFIRPATFGADGEGGLGDRHGGQNFTQCRCFAAFGQA